MMNARANSGESRRRGAVAVIVRGPRLLVIRRSQSVVAPGWYCFPGGGIEAEETDQAALVRELREELAIEVQPGRLLWQSVTPWNVELSWWLSQMSPAAVPTPNPAEVQSVHWFTPAEMLALPLLLESNRHFWGAVATGHVDLEMAAGD